MTKLDGVHEAAADARGMITSSEVWAPGIPDNELVQFSSRGKLVRLEQELYRVKRYAPTEKDAETVTLTDSDAFLLSESVLELLRLAPTNQDHVQVAVARRTRRAPTRVRLVRARARTSVASWGRQTREVT